MFGLLLAEGVAHEGLGFLDHLACFFGSSLEVLHQLCEALSVLSTVDLEAHGRNLLAYLQDFGLGYVRV